MAITNKPSPTIEDQTSIVGRINRARLIGALVRKYHNKNQTDGVQFVVGVMRKLISDQEQVVSLLIQSLEKGCVGQAFPWMMLTDGAKANDLFESAFGFDSETAEDEKKAVKAAWANDLFRMAKKYGVQILPPELSWSVKRGAIVPIDLEDLEEPKPPEAAVES
jgi:hypothetical protein